jgi:Glycosyl transferase family 2
MSGIDIVFVLNKSNNFGLQKDAEILEEGLRLQGKICGINISSIKIMDPREIPVTCDLCIHFEEPYAVWFSWARAHCLVVNPEWWCESWLGYAGQFSQWIFKTEAAQKRFVDAGICSLDNSTLIHWRSKAIEKVVNVASGPKAKTVAIATTAAGWVWFLGGSVNKRAAAEAVIPLWKNTWLPLTVYSTSALSCTIPHNVTLKINDLPVAEYNRLATYYPGHICLSKAEAFGHTASEAQSIGAFTILNNFDTYNEYYKNDDGVMWVKTPTSVVGMAEYADFSNKDQIIADLQKANDAYKSADLEIIRVGRRENTVARSSRWDKTMHDWFLAINNMIMNKPRLPKFYPPVLSTADCPPISIVTLVYGRPKFIDLAFHNLMLSDYPREKMEWVVVDDSPAEESASNKIMGFEQRFFPGKIRYIPLPKKVSIGRKRNIGCRRAAHGVILMMDDDDHYPQTSFRRRVAWLLKDKVPHKAAVCTSIAMYDLNGGLSAVNVPPFNLGLAERASEATLTFTADFWQDRPFLEVDMAEAEAFLKGRESDVVEMPPQQIIVSFLHKKNTSSRRVPGLEAKPGCFWGFPKQFLEFVHGLVDVTVEEETT